MLIIRLSILQRVSCRSPWYSLWVIRECCGRLICRRRCPFIHPLVCFLGRCRSLPTHKKVFNFNNCIFDSVIQAMDCNCVHAYVVMVMECVFRRLVSCNCQVMYTHSITHCWITISCYIHYPMEYSLLLVKCRPMIVMAMNPPSARTTPTAEITTMAHIGKPSPSSV